MQYKTCFSLPSSESVGEETHSSTPNFPNLTIVNGQIGFRQFATYGIILIFTAQGLTKD